MKILALEQELIEVDWTNEQSTLREEAQAAYTLLQKDILREIYFDQNKQAVLILECDSLKQAEAILAQLPIVSKGWVRFELKALLPYDGLSRLFS